MPTSRPRRSTPMSTARGWSSWSTPATRWRPRSLTLSRGFVLPAAARMLTYLDFEKPIAELETRVAELRETASSGSIDIDAEVGRLEAKSDKLLRDTYAKLTPWQKAQVARHPERPHFKDYVAGHRRRFPAARRRPRVRATIPAIIGGLARIDGRRVMLIGHEKGDDTASPPQAQFRDGQARGLSQGDPPDAAGRPVRDAGRDPGRYAGRLPRRRGRGARPGRGDRPLDRGMPGAQGADDRRRSSARAARAARSRSPRPIAC